MYELIHRADRFSGIQEGATRVATRGDQVMFNWDILDETQRAARVLKVDGDAILIDEEVEFEDGIEHAIRFRVFSGEDDVIGESVVRTVTGPAPRTRMLVATGDGPLPAFDDIVHFGRAGFESEAVVIRSLEPGEDLAAALDMRAAAPIIDQLTDAEVPPPWNGRVGGELTPGAQPPAVPRFVLIATGMDGTGDPDGLVVGLGPGLAPGTAVFSYTVFHRLAGGEEWDEIVFPASSAGGPIPGYESGDEVELRALATGVNGVDSGLSDIVEATIGASDAEIPAAPIVSAGGNLGHAWIDILVPAGDSARTVEIFANGGGDLDEEADFLDQVPVTPGVPLPVSDGDTTRINELLGPGFATGAPWTFGGGWAHDTDKATKSSGSTLTYVDQPVTVAPGDECRFAFDIVAITSTSVRAGLTGGTEVVSGDFYNTVGRHRAALAAVTGNDRFGIRGSNFRGSVDNLTFYRATPSSLPQGTRRYWVRGVNIDGSPGPVPAPSPLKSTEVHDADTPDHFRQYPSGRPRRRIPGQCHDRRGEKDRTPASGQPRRPARGRGLATSVSVTALNAALEAEKIDRADGDSALMQEIANLGETIIYFATLFSELELAADSITKPTWAELSAITGGRDGQRGFVPVSDTGTHTDPVTSATVQNAGIYGWSTAEAGWEWIAAQDDIDAELFAKMFPSVSVDVPGFQLVISAQDPGDDGDYGVIWGLTDEGRPIDFVLLAVLAEYDLSGGGNGGEATDPLKPAGWSGSSIHPPEEIVDGMGSSWIIPCIGETPRHRLATGVTRAWGKIPDEWPAGGLEDDAYGHKGRKYLAQRLNGGRFWNKIDMGPDIHANRGIDDHDRGGFLLDMRPRAPIPLAWIDMAHNRGFGQLAISRIIDGELLSNKLELSGVGLATYNQPCRHPQDTKIANILLRGDQTGGPWWEMLYSNNLFSHIPSAIKLCWQSHGNNRAYPIRIPVDDGMVYFWANNPGQQDDQQIRVMHVGWNDEVRERPYGALVASNLWNVSGFIDPFVSGDVVYESVSGQNLRMNDARRIGPNKYQISIVEYVGGNGAPTNVYKLITADFSDPDNPDYSIKTIGPAGGSIGFRTHYGGWSTIIAPDKALAFTWDPDTSTGRGSVWDLTGEEAVECDGEGGTPNSIITSSGSAQKMFRPRASTFHDWDPWNEKLVYGFGSFAEYFIGRYDQTWGSYDFDTNHRFIELAEYQDFAL